MRFNQFVLAGSLAMVFGSAEVMAQSQAQRCPMPNQNESSLTRSELQERMGRELVIKTPGMNPLFLEQFLFEYEKFPLSLRNEMSREGGTIHLIQGKGVMDDVTWPSDIYTKDGREWDKVPGAGGSIYSYPKNPTRIVVNNLYHRHGSVNLVLHEHAHTLDHLYSEKDISMSKTWTKLIQDEQNQNVMRGICGYYCLTDVRESFAELFAYYHACEETKQHMEQVLPSIAEFMAGLTNVKAFKASERKVSRSNEEPRRRRRTVGSFFKKLFNDLEDIVNN